MVTPPKSQPESDNPNHLLANKYSRTLIVNTMPEDWVEMKVAHGGSASRIFHETSLSLVKIPCPAPPIFWVRICQNSAETQCLTQHKKSRPRLGAIFPLQEILESWLSHRIFFFFRTNVPKSLNLYSRLRNKLSFASIFSKLSDNS